MTLRLEEAVGVFEMKINIFSTVSSDGKSLTDIKIRIASPLQISFKVKFKLYKILVLPILFYERESWTVVVEKDRPLQAFELKCFLRLMGISDKEHKT